MDVQAKWEEVRKRPVMEPVYFHTYRGTGHATRDDKAMHVLRKDDMVVLVGDRGKSGPATLKRDDTGAKAVGKFKSNAYFNLKNAGFEPEKIESVTGQFTSPFDLWEACFQGHHDRSLDAKRLFIELCGEEVGSAFEGLAKAAESVERERALVKAKAPYEDHPKFGLI